MKFREISSRHILSGAILLSLVAFLSAAFAAPAAATDWPHWRGPNYDGSTDETGLPTSWTPEDAIWTTEMPGPGFSTPVIVGNRLFLTSADNKTTALYSMCLSSETGEVLWQREVTEGRSWVGNNVLASSSVATDGHMSWHMFGNAVVVAFDATGKEVWRRNLAEDYGPPALFFVYSASPLYYKKRLYIPMLRDVAMPRKSEYPEIPKEEWLDSYLLCLDPATGENIWKKERPTEETRYEARQSYASPVPCEFDDQSQILLIGGNYLSGSDPVTGDEIWRLRYEIPNNFRPRVIPTPVQVGDIIIAAQPRNNPVFAVPVGLKGKHPYDDIVWEYDGSGSDDATPLYYRGRVYVLNGQRRRLSCLDVKTGKEIWMHDLEGARSFRASPTGADGKVYCIDITGKVYVIEAADTFHQLAKIEMEGHPTKSSIVAAQGKLFIRTAERLYCFQKK